MRIVALLVAPLFPALIAALTVAMKIGGFESDTPAVVAFGTLTAGYAAALVFGLPLSFLWERLGFNGVVGSIALGVASAVGLTVLVLPFLRSLRVTEVSLLQGLIHLLSVAIPLGAIGGLAFWWFRRRSPNNSLESDAGNPRASG